MKKLVPLFALLLAALALAACGGGSDTTGETAAETAPAGGAKEETSEGEKEAEGGTAGSASTLDIEADPSGNLAFTTTEASAKAGKVTVDFTNSSPVPHDVAIEDEGGETLGQTEVISEGSDSTEVELEPGTYTFYCSVPGHRQAGMEGELTVK
ncbi:MAG TPA: plastocyanin/azurin family copper-binding protein [Solirubrobacterales bacterium]|jgi:plastocyanin